MFPRLIALDMDGTLLNSDGQVSPRNLAALRHAIASGSEVVIATGRRHGYAMRVLRALNLPPCTILISSNGTVIRTLDAQLLHRSHLSLADARWLCSHVADFRNTLMLTFDTLTPTGEDTPRPRLRAPRRPPRQHRPLDAVQRPLQPASPRLEDASTAMPPSR